MDPVPADYNPHSLETEVLALWKTRRLPPAGGVLGPRSGPTVRQLTGGWMQGDFPSLVAERAVAADVDARYLGLVGRRASATLRQAVGAGHAPPSTVPALLTALGIWTGGDGRAPWDPEDRTAGVQAIIGRLAAKGVMVTRDESFRVCPSCGTPRSPERIVYDEEEGDTYLVRFPVRVKEWTVNALVWVDAPWKLLGASALLVNPELRYVVAGYHRREDRELVLTSAASLGRLRSWIPEATFEVIEERPGREFQGIAYTYPLRHEFPMGGDLTPPAGTILGAADVGESGTGIVALVPGHGPTDAQIAARIGVAGWPLLTPKGMLDVTLMHKYAGLDLDTANEFVLRDLSEAGALLARLRVKRGVPHCAVCGASLLWAPGRAWCLEPARLPPELRAIFSRLLPDEALPVHTEVAPWPVSEASTSGDASAVALLECAQCDRLEGPDGPKQCPCGGQRTVVRRRLLPSSGVALAAWARFDPLPEGDSVHLYVGDRRRVPALVNHLVALAGIEGSVPDVSLTVVPTIAATDAPELVAIHGADAVRAALVRSGLSESASGRFADRCRREADRIRRWWSLSREVVSMCDPAMLTAFARPISGFLAELEVEDRAIIARWERTRTLALSHYDQWAPGLAHRYASRFLDNDLIEYRELVRSRLALPGTPPSKRSALRTLTHLLRGLSEVLAPILPFTSEAVHRSLSSERASLFEQPMAGLDRSLLNDELAAAWDRWKTVLRSVDRFRRSIGVAPSTVLPSVVLVLSADDVGDRFRAEKEILARLARVQRVEVASPREPWTGRQRVLRPVESEIQKAYPTEASQIAHLLMRMAPRRWETATGQEELDVVINGLPRRVFPSMITFSNTLPERVVPFPWSLGDMYVESPAGAEAGRAPAPPLSSDAFWLVRRVERRLRTVPLEAGQRPRIALVTTKDPLASELRSLAEPIARYLGLGELRVVERAEEAVPLNALTGRTRTGDRWWVHVPDLPNPRPHKKHPCPGARLQRVPAASPSLEAAEVDYADEKLVAHEEAVRTLGQELDDIVGIPLLGPAKIAAAWEHGLHSVDDLRGFSYETVSALPGFGGPIAELFVSKLGGSVPARVRTRTPRGPGTSLPGKTAPPRASPTPVPEAVTRPSPPVPRTDPLEGSPPGLAVPPELLPSELPSPTEPTEPPEPAVEVPPSSPPPTGEVREEVRPPPEPAVPEESVAPVISGIAEPEPPTPEAPLEPVPVFPEGAGTSPPPPAPPLEVAAPSTEPPASAEVVPLAEPPVPPPPAEVAPPTPEAAIEPMPVPPDDAGTPPPSVAPPLEAPPSSMELPLAEEVVPLAEPPVAPTPPEVESVPESQLPLPEPEVIPGPTATEAPTAVPVPAELPPIEPTQTEPTSAEANAVPEPPTEESPAAGTVEPRATSEVSPPVEAEAPAPDGTTTAPAEPEEVVEPTPLEAEPPSPPSEVDARIEAAAPSEVVPPTPVPIAVPKPLEVERPKPTVEPPTPSLGVVVPPPLVVPPAEELGPPSPPTGVELTIGDSLVAALSGFLESTAAGHRGVCVVRESPERIRARVGSRPIEVLWLTNIGRGPSLRPSDLEGAWAFLSRKLLEERVTAFFFEGIEYLVRLHGADAVLNGLVQFDRLARENDARVWVCLAPSLMKSSDLERFRSTFGGGSSSS
ncbi:MAG: class I tRNA ligase family protein [Thermoplasmata archaeon]